MILIFLMTLDPDYLISNSARPHDTGVKVQRIPPPNKKRECTYSSTSGLGELLVGKGLLYCRLQRRGGDGPGPVSAAAVAVRRYTRHTDIKANHFYVRGECR